MFGASGSGSMLHNPAETKNYKAHANFLKKNREKQSPRKESFHRINHYPISDCSPENAPLKFKLKINASKGKVEVIRKSTVTSEQLHSFKSSVSPKPVKPKQIEKEYLNVRISQDVALANEPVHGGIADSVKTKKRRCKDGGGSVYTPESSSRSRDPPLMMLSPKKRKARKNVETNGPSKKWKSETSLNQKSHVQSERKSFGTTIKLYKEQDKTKGLWTSRELYNERYKKKSFETSRQLYDKQDNRKSLGTSRELFKKSDKRKSFGTSKELNHKHSMSLEASRELYKRIETTSTIISNPTLILKRKPLNMTGAVGVTSSFIIPKRKTFEPTPIFNVSTSSVIPNPTLILKRETLDMMPAIDVTTSSIIPNPTLILKRETLDMMPAIDVTTSSIIPKKETLKSMPTIDVTSSIIPNPTLIPKQETLDLLPPLDVTTSSIIPKKEALDLTPPFDLIFEIEREFSQMCNTVCLDKVESTVTDPIFKNVTKKFQESSEVVVKEYLAGGYPDVQEVEKVSFAPVLAEKIQHPQESFNHCASPGNVFLSCTSSQELVIASYEDAVEIEITDDISSCSLESPPYGSQDSGYTSMTSPLSDDPEFLNPTYSKSIDQADRPVRLTDVQFLKMCHNYSKCGGPKKWSATQLLNNQNSKTSRQYSKIINNPTTKKNPHIPVVKIVSTKCVAREEPRKEFSPRGNEHAKALHDRRVVYLGNIPSTYTVQYLREKFKRFGEIENIQIKSKISDELDVVDYRLLSSLPLKGNSSNSVKGNVQKGKIMKHFGFVTFKKIAVAREVFDKRRELCTWAGGSINYGGRREFVREDYADFDAEANNVNPGCSYKQNQENEVDYTQLLKKEQEKRGLIISPNSKRPQHSHHV